MINKFNLCSLICFLLSATSVAVAGDVTFYVDGGVGIDQVYCGSQAKPCKTIGYTVTNKAQQNNNTTINIAAGTYPESINIFMKNIYLKGSGQNITTIQGDLTQNAIQITGPSSSKISDLSVTKGNSGIVVRSANIFVSNAGINNNVEGISAKNNSTVSIDLSSFDANAGSAISLWANSTANIDSTIISGKNFVSNATSILNTGISVRESSVVYISNSTISDYISGLFIIADSTASVQDSTLTSNKQFGISVAGHSSVRLSGGNIIDHNGDPNNLNSGAGMIVGQSSQASIQSNPNSKNVDQITANYGLGIHLHRSSSLTMFDGIIGPDNGSHGIMALAASQLDLMNQVSIVNNKGWGLSCDASTTYIGTTANITGNLQGQKTGC